MAISLSNRPRVKSCKATRSCWPRGWRDRRCWRRWLRARRLHAAGGHPDQRADRRLPAQGGGPRRGLVSCIVAARSKSTILAPLMSGVPQGGALSLHALLPADAES